MPSTCYRIRISTCAHPSYDAFQLQQNPLVPHNEGENLMALVLEQRMVRDNALEYFHL